MESSHALMHSQKAHDSRSSPHRPVEVSLVLSPPRPSRFIMIYSLALSFTTGADYRQYSTAFASDLQRE